MTTVTFAPSGPLRGAVVAPPDKSISHRAALLGAMSREPVRISNYLRAQDTLSTLEAMRAVGAQVDERDDGTVVVRGCGLRDALEPGGPIDVGNAGTLMRLLPGWLASQVGRIFVLDGDDSIRRRPVDRIMAPLALMGAQIEARQDRFAPFVVHGRPLEAITYDMPVASAQVKSCVLLAGLGAEGTTSVVEPEPSRDHTERMLAGAGIAVTREGRTVSVTGADALQSRDLVVPGDLSSAAFMIAAGVLVPGSRLVVRDVGANWTRTGFLRILERMGAAVAGELEDPSDVVALERADLRPRGDRRPARRHDRRGRRGAAGDRRAAARGAAGLLRRGRDRRARRAGAAREGVRPDRRRRRRAARARRDDRGDRRRLRGDRRSARRPARRHDRRARRSPHGDARRGRRPGVARGRRPSSAWRPPRSPIRASSDDLAPLA